jgi:tetratricopeptide (TPR) repeat protein
MIPHMRSGETLMRDPTRCWRPTAKQLRLVRERPDLVILDLDLRNSAATDLRIAIGWVHTDTDADQGRRRRPSSPGFADDYEQACCCRVSHRDRASGYDLFQKALVLERTEGNLPEAIKLYRRIVERHSSDRMLAAKALLQMGQCYEKLGQADARKCYEQLLRQYADQNEVATEAREPSRGRAGAQPSVGITLQRSGKAGVRRSPCRCRASPSRLRKSAIWLRDLATRQDRASPTRRLERLIRIRQLRYLGRQQAIICLAQQGEYHELPVVGVDGSHPRTVYTTKFGHWLGPCSDRG